MRDVWAYTEIPRTQNTRIRIRNDQSKGGGRREGFEKILVEPTSKKADTYRNGKQTENGEGQQRAAGVRALERGVKIG